MQTPIIEREKKKMDNTTMAIAAGGFVAGLFCGWIAREIAARKSCKCGSRSGAAFRKGQNPGQQSPRPAPKRHAPPADGSTEIYVGNISYDLTEDQLRKEFEAFGKVNFVRIITNTFNGRSKGFGFVHMPNKSEVDAAIAALNEKEILGRRLRCNVAKNV